MKRSTNNTGTTAKKGKSSVDAMADVKGMKELLESLSDVLNVSAVYCSH